MAQFFKSFKTSLGLMLIAWTELGILAVELPAYDEADTVCSLKRRFPDARETNITPDFVENAIDLLIRHLNGHAQIFQKLPLDLSRCTEFSRKVYEETSRIQSGQLLSYGDIARKIGKTGASRAVGRALGANPIPIIVPCHRVLGKNGKLTGFSAYGGCDMKLKLLSIEGALASDAIPLSAHS